MKKIKQLIKLSLLTLYLGLPEWIRTRIRKNHFIILYYHEISPERFREHIDFLKSKFSIIGLKQAKQHLYGETDQPLPRDALVITFDDGWRSNYQLLPVIREQNLPLTIFLTTGLIGTNRKIWNYTLDRHGKERDLNERLKAMSNEEKNKELYEIKGYHPKKEYAEREFLSFDEIDEMAPYVDFQSHGMFHSVFTRCSNRELSSEMADSRNYLEQKLGHQCYAIAYPYGKYGQREIDRARHCGYSVGRTANDARMNALDSDPLRLGGLGVGDHIGVPELNRVIAWGELRSVFVGKHS